MTTDTQYHEAIRGLLENALRQVETTQSQVTAVEGQLHDIKTQIDQSLEAIDSVLKQLENREHQAEKVRGDVAATLGEMFEQMTRIVNGARDQMMQQHANDHHRVKSIAQIDAETQPAGELPEPSLMETTSESEADSPVPQVDNATDNAIEVIIDEPAPTPMQAIPTEQPPADPLTGSEVGQRAADSLNEVIATIDETKTYPETLPEIETQSKLETESATNEPHGPGSAESLSTLLAKARAVSGETEEVATEAATELPLEIPSFVGEDEDAEAVSELLKNTSGSFVTTK